MKVEKDRQSERKAKRYDLEDSKEAKDDNDRKERLRKGVLGD